MATLIRDGKRIFVPDGDSVIPAAKELGVNFSCEIGVCKSCCTRVKSGMEHLSNKTDAEKNMGVKESERLICQCRILEGDVELA